MTTNNTTAPLHEELRASMCRHWAAGLRKSEFHNAVRRDCPNATLDEFQATADSIWAEMGSDEDQESKETNDTITINDPELAALFREKNANTGDIPAFIWVGETTVDGRTREDFEFEQDFEDEMPRLSVKFATIAQVDAHLAYEGRKAREQYMRILSLQSVRDHLLDRAAGDTSAKFWDLLQEHLIKPEYRKSDAA